MLDDVHKLYIVHDFLYLNCCAAWLREMAQKTYLKIRKP